MKIPKFLKSNIVWLAIFAILIVPTAGKADINDVFKGFSWSPNIGWISINNTNNNGLYPDLTCSGGKCAYGITVDDTRNVSGWAWSSNFGWICFGATCTGYGTPPGGGAPWATFDYAASPQIQGWGRILSLYTINPGGQEGWISFNCKTDISGHPARSVCGTSNYQVSLDTATGSLQGYAWNNTTVGGVGWIKFNPNYGSAPPPNQQPGTFGGVPWIQVKYGDLYAKGSISTPSPFAGGLFSGTVNATYCIDTGATGVTHFAQGSQCTHGITNTSINTPSAGSYYANTLGRIKLRGYNSSLQPTATGGDIWADLAAQKYGPWQQAPVSSGTILAIPTTLGGKVYDTKTVGDWYLPSTTFQNAAAGGNGSGLIIVRGNLTITGDITYGSGLITNLKQLASLGILVLYGNSTYPGNLTVQTAPFTPGPATDVISANIYAEGTVATGSTGDPNTDSPLVINGVVVAHQFNFQRQFSGSNSNASVLTPAEQITYDGRIVANTPPGMSDFVGTLPIVSY